MLALVLIGSMWYQPVMDCKTFGAVDFPPNDTIAHRQIHVCPTADNLQKFYVAEHELLHICFHDHVHSFATIQELKEHVDHKFNEEDLATFLTPCMVENRDAVYKVYGVNPNELSHR